MRPTGSRARLDQALRDHAIDDRVAGLVLEAAERRPVEPCWSSATEVALAAASDAYGALYVRRGSLAIALDRERARTLQLLHGFGVGDDGGPTARLRVSSADLRDPERRELVLGIVLEALDRSDDGPRWSRGLPDRVVRRGGLCPGCGLELSLTGVCPVCD